jgi:hypothetical protein
MIYFIRHGIVVSLTNEITDCPVGELAKAIDDKILKTLANCDKKAR